MRIIFPFFLISFLISYQVNSQSVPAPYSVGTWSGFRNAAISYTFDDGCPNQFKVAIPLFDEYNYKLTLFTVSSWIVSWSDLKNAAQYGHEEASHTTSHPNLSQLTAEEQNKELEYSKIAIESNIPGYSCLTHAYPYCVKGIDSICSKYYISARGCQGNIEGKTPASYLNISSVIGGDLGSVKTFANFETNFKKTLKNNGWCVFLFHGVDNDGGYSPIASTELRNSLDYLFARKSQYWVTTFLNATLYSMERNSVNLVETATTNSSKTLEVSDNLPDSIYNYPLTFRLPLPVDWPSANVTQNAVEVSKRIVLVDNLVYLTFDVVPDAGQILITKNNTPVVPEIDSVPDENPTPTGFSQPKNKKTEIESQFANNTLSVLFPAMASNNALISFYDMKGNRLASKLFSHPSGKKVSINLNPNSVMPGVYVVTINNGEQIWNKKIIVN
jgi:oligosaccharide reducing-end xylanase